VGQDKNLFRFPDDGPQLFRLREVERHRLVADDIKAALEKKFGGRKMLVVGRDDHDEVQAFVRWHFRLGPGHLRVAAVNPRRIEEKIGARSLRAHGVRGKRARDQLGLAVHAGGDAVHRTDERTAPAADHAETKFAIHG
jgi:hypothetical protein